MTFKLLLFKLHTQGILHILVFRASICLCSNRKYCSPHGERVLLIKGFMKAVKLQNTYQKGEGEQKEIALSYSAQRVVQKCTPTLCF